MNKSNILTAVIGKRTVVIYTAAVLVVLGVVSLLLTRQIIYFDDSSQAILFVVCNNWIWGSIMDSFRIHKTN